MEVRYQLQVMYLYKKRVDMMQKLNTRIYSFSCDLECRVSSCLTDTQSWTRTRSRIYVSSVECNIGMLLNGAKDSPSHIRMHLCQVFINLVYYENKGIYKNLIKCLRIISYTLFINAIDKPNPIWQCTGTSLKTETPCLFSAFEHFKVGFSIEQHHKLPILWEQFPYAVVLWYKFTTPTVELMPRTIMENRAFLTSYALNTHSWHVQLTWYQLICFNLTNFICSSFI